ncbi:hypothetical protein BIS06_21675, partial [Halomonas sp. BBD48]|nr:hypothetical protein [Halomonas sp. BBD48]
MTGFFPCHELLARLIFGLLQRLTVLRQSAVLAKATLQPLQLGLGAAVFVAFDRQGVLRIVELPLE